MARVHAPERIVTDWRRFATGLWRLPEGDISAAYSADVFPKLKVFTHEDRQYTNCGNCFSGIVRTTATCFPLIPPENYQGPESVRYSYEGKEGHFRGRKYRLGPKVLFDSSDPLPFEWTELYRVMYADGGCFAKGVTYLEFLTARSSPKTENEREAHAGELVLCHTIRMPETQEEMKDLLAESTFTTFETSSPQMELLL